MMVNCDDVAEITRNCDDWVQEHMIREMPEWDKQGGAISIISRESNHRFNFYVKISVGYHVYNFHKKMKRGKHVYSHSFLSNEDLEAINIGLR